MLIFKGLKLFVNKTAAFSGFPEIGAFSWKFGPKLDILGSKSSKA